MRRKPPHRRAIQPGNASRRRRVGATGCLTFWSTILVGWSEFKFAERHGMRVSDHGARARPHDGGPSSPGKLSECPARRISEGEYVVPVDRLLVEIDHSRLSS